MDTNKNNNQKPRDGVAEDSSTLKPNVAGDTVGAAKSLMSTYFADIRADVKEMDKAIHALFIQVPTEVAQDFQRLWNNVRHHLQP